MLKIYLAAFGVILASSGQSSALTMGQPTQPTVGQPVAVDSTGKIVGPMLSPDTLALTLKSGQVVRILFSRRGFENQRGLASQYLYKSSNCTGTRYMAAMGLPIQAVAVIVPPTNTILNAGLNITSEIISSYEYYDSTQNKFVCRTTGSTAKIDVAPIVVTQIDSLGFTPPFTVIMK
ncbi:MAG: hypothetical protein QM651_12500 [Rhodoblastus sp.]